MPIRLDQELQVRLQLLMEGKPGRPLRLVYPLGTVQPFEICYYSVAGVFH